MSLTTSEMTPADIAAVTNHSCNNNCNDGWGGGWSSWIILFLIFGMFGWGGFGGFGGFGGNAGINGALTRADLCQDMNFSQLENGVRGIQQGICDSTFALDNTINSLGTNVMQGFSQAELSRCSQQSALMQQLYQLGYNQQDCCCKTQNNIERANYDTAMRNSETNRLIDRGFCDTNYNAATNTTAIIQNAHNDADRIIARFDAFERNQDKETIATLRQELQAAQFRESQSAQNNAFGARIDAAIAEILRRSGHDCPSAAYIVQPPTPVTFPTNCCGQAMFSNNSCGNSGCC